MKSRFAFHRVRAIRRPASIRRWSAFTLLEVLLALSLSIVLLAAVYGAFDLYVRFTVVGNDDIQQAQIARALLRRMSTDIRSVIYRPASAGSTSSSNSSAGSNSSSNSNSNSNSNSQSSSGTGTNSQSSSSQRSGSGSSGGGGGSGSRGNVGGSRGSSGSQNQNSSGSSNNSGNTTNQNNTSTEESTVVDPTAGYSRGMTGLIGDGTTIVLHAARASRQSPLQNETAIVGGLPANSGEERSISYFLADARADGLAGIVGDAYKKTHSTSGDVQGLARLEGNRLAIQIADEQSDEESLAENSKVLAPEVVGMQLRYFDGVDWYDSWDTGVMQTLPQAVEITLRLRRTGKKDTKPRSTRDGEPPSDVYSLTVAIPSAEPYVPPTQ